MISITFFVPDSILKIVKQEAIRKNIPYSQLIRAAIWEQLKKERLIGADILNDLTVQAQCYVKK
jgi:hypothetical protein